MSRWAFNWYPAFRRTGARITHIAPDWSEVQLSLPLNVMTRNPVGTIFGGSMYAAVDPIYMIMLMKKLGQDCEVWVKSGSIRFRKPARETLFAQFLLSTTEIAGIRRTVEAGGKIDRKMAVDLFSRSGEMHASCEMVLSIRQKPYLG